MMLRKKEVLNQLVGDLQIQRKKTDSAKWNNLSEKSNVFS